MNVNDNFYVIEVENEKLKDYYWTKFKGGNSYVLRDKPQNEIVTSGDPLLQIDEHQIITVYCQPLRIFKLRSEIEILKLMRAIEESIARVTINALNPDNIKVE